MINIETAKRKNTTESCLCCMSLNDTKRIKFSIDGTMGTMVTLCKNCRNELIKAIQTDDKEVGA